MWLIHGLHNEISDGDGSVLLFAFCEMFDLAPFRQYCSLCAVAFAPIRTVIGGVCPTRFDETPVHFVHAESVGLGCRDVPNGRHPQIAIGRATFGPFLVELWRFKFQSEFGTNLLPG